MLPREILKSGPSKTAIPSLSRPSAGVTSGVSRSEILSFRRELYLSGTVSSAPHRTRRLEKFRFLGLHRDRGARVLKWGAYNN